MVVYFLCNCKCSSIFIIWTFGEHITTLRKRKGLSQGELGKAVGTSGDIIGKYERGEVKPPVEVAAKIADALDVSLDYLVGASSFVVKDKKMLHPPGAAGEN